MYLNRLSEDDLFGRFFLKLPGKSGLDGYFQTLSAAEPLLSSAAWIEAVTGFYLNVGKGDSLRISYFTDANDAPEHVIGDFLAENVLEYSQQPEQPGNIRVSSAYGGEELRFRKFLSTYARIGLEIMVTNLLHARCLFATFRFQVMRPREPYRAHFESTFSKQSHFYRSLSFKELSQFWDDMSHWPNPPEFDWAHMFVNMVLGRDCNITPFLEPRPGLSYGEINEILRKTEMGFEIPKGWQPTMNR